MLHKIKRHYNVTSVILAKYINTSLHTLKSLLTNRRAYNLAQLQKLIPLYNALAIDTPVTGLTIDANFLALEKQQAIPLLQKQLERVKKDLFFKNKALQAITTTREDWLRGLHGCTELLKNESLTLADKQWIGLRKRHLETRLLENSYGKLLQLQIDVKGLTTLYELLKGQINEIEIKDINMRDI